MGSKNHEVVPTPLIIQLSALRSGSGAHKSISTLAKANLIARTKNAKYDGYRLTYGGLDYLSLHTHLKQKAIYSVGNQIGTGKESDIFVVASPSGVQDVLKIHRLGRISFRTVKANRDYLRHRSSASWMYMSRLAALKEFTFMQALRESGIRVPEPLACNRHTIVMKLIDAFPLRQIQDVPDPAKLYAELIEMILKLSEFGLIHGDFNEFNILIKEDEVGSKHGKSPMTESLEDNEQTLPVHKLTPYLIDFPQMVSIDHTNAEMYFDRDVSCVKKFFERRFHFTSDESGPHFADAKKRAQSRPSKRLDVKAEASGFSKKMAKELEKYMQEVGAEGNCGGDSLDNDDSDSDGSDAQDVCEDPSNDSENVEHKAGEVESGLVVAEPAPPADQGILNVSKFAHLAVGGKT